MYELTIDTEMRIAMNGPHEREMNWAFYSKRWLKVLSKSSPILLGDKGQGFGKSRSQVLEKLRRLVTSKEYRDLKCSFYTVLPPRQAASDKWF